MSVRRHRHIKPPKAAFISSLGDKVVDEIIFKERSYTLHPRKGWRSRRLPKQRRKTWKNVQAVLNVEGVLLISRQLIVRQSQLSVLSVAL